MNTTVMQRGAANRLRDTLERVIPKIVLGPTFLTTIIFIYGYIAWTAWLSFTDSRLLPNYKLTGLGAYIRLFNNERWWVAVHNLVVFGVLFVGISMFIGLAIAILLDQRIRAEGTLRSVFLYPMALSYIVTGTVWQWLLNPTLGLERVMHQWGFSHFTFDWLVNSDKAIYCVVMAAVWQSSGFVMALFLAGLRGIDDSIIKAAQVDGATLPRIYWRIIIPTMRPVFFSSLIILTHLAIKAFDLVIALTAGGPGFSTDLPATFMYAFTFNRSEIAIGACSAIMMLLAVAVVIIPYVVSELRSQRNG